MNVIFLFLPDCGIITGNIARSAKRWYYSEADFEVFLPTGATRCNDGGEIWRGGGAQGAYPLCDFHKICRICTTFQVVLRC